MSEQYGVRWDQVDFERRQVHLPKTKNGDPRTIPLNAVTLAALNRHRGNGRAKASDLVFPSIRSGTALQGSRGWFPTALEDAKIEGYSRHCNRHTFASRLVMAGVDLRTVAELLGQDGHAVLASGSRGPGLGSEPAGQGARPKGHQNGHQSILSKRRHNSKGGKRNKVNELQESERWQSG
jgi:hypothetical protein